MTSQGYTAFPLINVPGAYLVSKNQGMALIEGRRLF